MPRTSDDMAKRKLKSEYRGKRIFLTEHGTIDTTRIEHVERLRRIAKGSPSCERYFEERSRKRVGADSKEGPADAGGAEE